MTYELEKLISQPMKISYIKKTTLGHFKLDDLRYVASVIVTSKKILEYLYISCSRS